MSRWDNKRELLLWINKISHKSGADIIDKRTCLALKPVFGAVLSQFIDEMEDSLPAET